MCWWTTANSDIIPSPVESSSQVFFIHASWLKLIEMSRTPSRVKTWRKGMDPLGNPCFRELFSEELLPGDVIEITEGMVVWDGNGLAYPHRAGFRPVSDQCQTSPSSPPYTVHVTVPLLPHAQSMSPCRMSDLRSDVGCTEVSHVGFAECHFTDAHSLDRIIHEN